MFEAEIEFVKRHPYAIGGVVLSIIVFYVVYKSASGGSSAPAGSTSAQDLQLAQLQTAAGVQESQVQGQVQVAQTTANVQNNQTDAALQSTQLQTAAQLQLGIVQTQAAVATAQIQSDTALGINKGNNETSVTLAKVNDDAQLQSDQLAAQVTTDQTAIEGQTIVAVAQAKNAVGLAQVAEQSQVLTTLTKAGKLGGDSTGVAQVISAIYGKPIAAPPTSTVAQNITAVGGAVGSAGSLLGGLFA